MCFCTYVSSTQRRESMNLENVVSKTLELIRAYLHAIQSGCDVAHHGHEEEGYLEDGVLKEVEAVHDTFVHARVVHVDEEGEDP